MLSPDWSHSSAAGLGAQSRGEGEAGAGSLPSKPCRWVLPLLSVQGGIDAL